MRATPETPDPIRHDWRCVRPGADATTEHRDGTLVTTLTCRECGHHAEMWAS